MKKFLVTGLGSMGKRRVRCLKALGYDNDIIGFDLRADRREEAEQKYGIKTVDNLEKINFSEIKAVIISTPPDRHAQFAKIAIDNNKPVFIEASVILEDVLDIQKHNKNNVFVAPSCTMTYHSMVKDIKAIVDSGKYGKVTNFSFHTGQYLPDWHPWEAVKDFYVSNRATGGAREIVPFELTWLINVLGLPSEVKGAFSKTIDCGADIEDTYAFIMKYEDKVGSIVIDVASRFALRNLIINLETAQIQWMGNEESIRLYEADNKRWINYEQPVLNTEKGYSIVIGEQMYIDEVSDFIAGIDNRAKYHNSIEADLEILNLLKNIEDSDGGFDRFGVKGEAVYA